MSAKVHMGSGVWFRIRRLGVGNTLFDYSMEISQEIK